MSQIPIRERQQAPRGREAAARQGGPPGGKKGGQPAAGSPGAGQEASQEAGRKAGRSAGRDAGRSAGRDAARDAGRKDRRGARDEPIKIRTAPTTLNELLTAAQQMKSEGADQSEIVEFVQWVAGRCGIRVRHDQHEPHAISGEEAAAKTTAEATAAAKTTAEATAAAKTTAEATAAADATAEATAEAAAAPVAKDNDESLRADPAKPKQADDTKRKSKKAILAAKAASVVPVTIIRQRDGTHVLAIGQTPGTPAAEARPAAVAKSFTVGRLVLSVDKRGDDSKGFGAQLRSECNGVVIDARKWRALAIPPGAFSHNPATKAVNLALAQRLYDVIKVDDGTVVTLYSWDHPTDGPVWSLASSNGYDVSSLYWVGGLTYAEVFYDVARRYATFLEATGMTLEPAESGARLNFAKLDRKRCYTVGFRHHNFHPMREDPERMWQIQSADTSNALPVVTFSEQGAGLPGIPNQCVLPDESVYARGAGITVEALRREGKDALSRAIAYVALAKGERDESPGVPRGPVAEIEYGFILRSRNAALTVGYSDCLIETPLLARIRKIAYEQAPRAVRDDLSRSDRLDYNALRAFLTATDRADFLSLYPGWTSKFHAYGEFVDNVVHLVIHALRQREMAPASREPALRSATGQIAKALLDHICRHEKLTAFHKDTEKCVRDYVVNPEYTFMFLRAMRAAR